ncbi:MAG: transglutaminase family protein, partial [Desulfofustis sp.]
MKYSVNHSTIYTYSHDVFLEPHLIRLCPRSDPGQRLLSYELDIVPQPAGVSHGVDAENNPFHLAWFSYLTDRFEMNARFTVETLKTNPFDSFLTCADELPLSLSREERTVLAPCLDQNIYIIDERDRQAVDGIVEEAKVGAGTVVGFLSGLNRYLYETIDKITRLDSGLQSISRTLETARGACRDTALVFMMACRAVSIPARFVSGCQEGDPAEPGADLHGWAEVYLPGFGWRGYDPTYGLAVADRHVAYAASAIVANAAP